MRTRRARQAGAREVEALGPLGVAEGGGGVLLARLGAGQGSLPGAPARDQGLDLGDLYAESGQT